jgi:hypothetical protein
MHYLKCGVKGPSKSKPLTATDPLLLRADPDSAPNSLPPAAANPTLRAQNPPFRAWNPHTPSRHLPFAQHARLPRRLARAVAGRRGGSAPEQKTKFRTETRAWSGKSAKRTVITPYRTPCPSFGRQQRPKNAPGRSAAAVTARARNMAANPLYAPAPKPAAGSSHFVRTPCTTSPRSGALGPRWLP